MKVRPRLALRIYSENGTLRRPQVINRSGQGGAIGSLSAGSEASGAGHQPDGSQTHGRRGLTRLTSNGRPIRSANPMAWFSMPACPGVSTQHAAAGDDSLTRRS